jgi:hypothetical protein
MSAAGLCLGLVDERRARNLVWIMCINNIGSVNIDPLNDIEVGLITYGKVLEIIKHFEQNSPVEKEN